MTATARSIETALVALALLLASVAVAPPARAVVACGDIVTTDLTLTEDLVCNGTDALVIGADGITIDLAGFTIRNTSSGAIVNGVTVDGHDDVTVRNGRVLNFYRNVIFENADRGLAQDLVIRRGGGLGLAFLGSTDSVASNIDVRNVPDGGVVVTDSGGVTATEITARRTTWGVFVTDSVGTVVRNSDLRRSFYGFYVYLGNGNTIEDSVLANNSVAGAASELATKTNVIANDIRGNAIGVHFVGESDGGAVLDSRVVRNGIGVQIGFADAFTSLPANNVRVLRNTIRNNDGAGVFVDQDTRYPIPHRIEGNRVAVNGHSPGTLVDSLAAPLDDGIHVVAPTGEVSVGSNVANRNADLGIEAPGALDLGGNRARLNGDPLQCVGVTCS